MEVKLYLNDPNTTSSLSIIDADYFELEFEFEMVTLGATNTNDYDGRYTSLKDISPPPELSRKESWREVPLKDPLVQQAAWAWAYLPFSKAEHQRSSFLGKLKNGFVGCFKNVILAIAAKLLPDENCDIDDQETCESVD